MAETGTEQAPYQPFIFDYIVERARTKPITAEVGLRLGHSALANSAVYLFNTPIALLPAHIGHEIDPMVDQARYVPRMTLYLTVPTRHTAPKQNVLLIDAHTLQTAGQGDRREWAQNVARDFLNILEVPKLDRAIRPGASQMFRAGPVLMDRRAFERRLQSHEWDRPLPRNASDFMQELALRTNFALGMATGGRFPWVRFWPGVYPLTAGEYIARVQEPAEDELSLANRLE